MTTTSPRLWSEAEEDELVRLRAEGKNWREIGAALGRSAGAVEFRWYHYGLEARNGGPPPAPDVPAAPSLPLDLEQLFQLGGTLMGLFEPLPPPVRTLLLDWLNKKYR